MKVTETSLPGVLLIEPKVFSDIRGYFLESYHKQRYHQAGIKENFVQDNLSSSARGVLRGLHYQKSHPQGKLVSVTQGVVFDVAVDVRRGSPHYGKWYGAFLSEDNRHQIYIPPGFAHGFCVVSDNAHFLYKCTDYYSPQDEGAIIWNDPDIGIEWPESEIRLSEKDASAPLLANIPPDGLPAYQGES